MSRWVPKTLNRAKYMRRLDLLRKAKQRESELSFHETAKPEGETIIGKAILAIVLPEIVLSKPKEPESRLR